MNLLTTRLKNIKQELTNLKTAHQRGIGNLRVYNKYCEGLDTNLDQTLTITINFSTNYAAYPFFQVLKAGGSLGQVDFTGMDATYSNNGYRVVVTVYDINAWYLSFGFYVLSTAPVESVDYHY